MAWPLNRIGPLAAIARKNGLGGLVNCTRTTLEMKSLSFRGERTYPAEITTGILEVTAKFVTE